MKVVKVYGELRKRLGQCRFEFDVATPAQAVKALCVNFPGLDKWLIDSEQNGVAYRVRVGREEATPADMSVLGLPWSEREVFSITPVVAGAGGVGRVIAGALLITAAVVFAPAAAAGGGFLTAAAAGTSISAVGVATVVAGNIGIYLALSGIAEMISPINKPGFEASKEAARLQNMSFSGVVNTARQGLPVPIAYGRVFVGSAVISSGFDVDHTASETEEDQDPISVFLENKSS